MILTTASSMIWARFIRSILMGLLGGAAIASVSAAQAQQGQAVSGSTRAELTAQLRVADSLHRTDEAYLLRDRLQRGEFEVGDVIKIGYSGLGIVARSDSLNVGEGKILHLGDPLGDLSVDGMLRSELADSVTGRVNKYFKQVATHVTVLLRLSLNGAVPRPGFYYVNADAPLSDLIMRTVGQGQYTDLHNVVIRRGTQTIWTAADVQSALAEGLTVQKLNLLPGDEVVFGEKHPGRILQILSVSVGLLGLLATFWRLR